MFYFIYIILSTLLLPLYLVVYTYRLFIGKDNIRSIAQRLVITSHKKSQGRLIWLHAASVGESTSAKTIIQQLSDKHTNIKFLLTTGTLSSAQIVSKWKIRNLYHQYTPNDNILLINRFLNKCQPDLAIFIESELWPCMLRQTSNRCAVLLINARLSERSFFRWKKYNSIFRDIMQGVTLVLAQSVVDMKKYKELGIEKVYNYGNLKFSNDKLVVNKNTLKKFKKIIADTPIIVAASTHIEDEEVILPIVNNLLLKENIFFTVIVIRHPERRKEVISLCNYYKLQYSLKSKTPFPKKGDNVFIVDSFGELGTFYSLADIAIIGGSFKRGGHNLVEAAYFNCAIIVGPDMSHYHNITNEMINKKAVLQLANKKEIQDKLELLINQEGKQLRNELANNALKYVDPRKKVITKYISKIDEFLKDIDNTEV